MDIIPRQPDQSGDAVSVVDVPERRIEQVDGRISGIKSLRSTLDKNTDLKDFFILTHRVIEHHIGVLSSVSRKLGVALQPPQKRSLINSLKFFEHIEPLHHADEVFTLFPRLKLKCTNQKVINMIDKSVIEHNRLESLHANARQLGMNWLASNELALNDARELNSIVSAIQEVYISHLRTEEDTLFAAINGAFDLETRSLMRTEVKHRWASE